MAILSGTGHSMQGSSSFRLQSCQFSYQPSRTSFINNITPTFWSASQLVGESQEEHGEREDDSDNDTVVSALGDDGEVTFVTPVGHDHPNEDSKFEEAREESLKLVSAQLS